MVFDGTQTHLSQCTQTQTHLFLRPRTQPGNHLLQRAETQKNVSAAMQLKLKVELIYFKDNER